MKYSEKIKEEHILYLKLCVPKNYAPYRLPAHNAKAIIPDVPGQETTLCCLNSFFNLFSASLELCSAGLKSNDSEVSFFLENGDDDLTARLNPLH